jgi:hypothetical protein
VRIVILSIAPARLAGVSIHPGDNESGVSSNRKGTVVNDSALAKWRVNTHTPVTAVAYEEEGARIHGLDGLLQQHSL